jgi:hypothetical protein
MLSGAMGQLYGNKYTWQFLDGWENHLDTTGSKEMTYLVNLFSNLPWFRLVPDRNHTLVTAGYGTFAPTSRVDDTDYVTAARTSDGRLAMAYLPGIRTITVDLKKLAGKVRARWFDPTTGGYVPIAGSPFDNKRKVNFRPPGKNSDGDDDWILVLTA